MIIKSEVGHIYVTLTQDDNSYLAQIRAPVSPYGMINLFLDMCKW